MMASQARVSLAAFLLLLGAWGRKNSPRDKEQKRIRVVETERCPKCNRKVPFRAASCPACGHLMESPWWERF